MNEEITYPPMLNLNQLLPLDALFLYCASNIGEFTINKETKTITFNSTYVYDENAIVGWSELITQAKSDYESALEPGVEMTPNDDQLFMNCREMVDIATQLVG
tara:strand:+ start:439 stop:747 length:309 start_codon:yes stop_codon:yes gene_type:complete